MGIFLLIVVVTTVVLVVIKVSNDNEKAKDSTDKIKAWMEENGFEITSTLEFNSGRYLLYLDETNRQMLLFEPLRDRKDILAFDNIIGMEIIEDGVSTNGVGRAVVGGALFGVAGAIVGSNTGKKTVGIVKAVIYTNSISNPQREIILNTMQIKTDSMLYKQAIHSARKIDATVRAIVAQNESRARSNEYDAQRV